MRRRFLLVCCALSLVGGMGLSGDFALKAFRAWQTLDWEEGDAEMLSSDAGAPNGPRSRCYPPRAAYRYSAKGTQFTGQRIRAADSCMSGNELREFQAEFRKGDTVDVYYDPAHPSEAVLQPGRLWCNDWIQACFGLLFMGFGIVTGIRILRKQR
ncbi:DUF3592 domain-containing protein [Polaromonas sp. YR568]|uniref:DUF3592 domain-containing protein n=1 Tax=Polaromonas sp. YR568 TaxID=1855301 RepID=UPI00398BFD4E